MTVCHWNRASQAELQVEGCFESMSRASLQITLGFDTGVDAVVKVLNRKRQHKIGYDSRKSLMT